MTSILTTDITESETYKAILKHRQTCPSWIWKDNKTSQFCLDCFGGGLVKFFKSVQLEFDDKRIKSQNIMRLQNRLLELSDIAEKAREQIIGTKEYFKIIKIFDAREAELKQELAELQKLNKFDPFEITILSILYNCGRPLTTNEIVNNIGSNRIAVKVCLIKLEESNYVRHKLTNNSILWRLETDERNNIANRRRFL